MEIDDQYLYDDYEMEGDEAEEITEVWGVEYVFWIGRYLDYHQFVLSWEGTC